MGTWQPCGVERDGSGIVNPLLITHNMLVSFIKGGKRVLAEQHKDGCFLKAKKEPTFTDVYFVVKEGFYQLNSNFDV